jgi:1-deoxy-D-xylulose-5-phosphate synthase
MILEKCDSPQDIKKLSFQELRALSTEIRELIIQVVSAKGGHLASSLGAVELCVAMHYCMNSPADDIIFDVGHQCYAHKILTGRRRDFYKLREYGGISGFPNNRESKYDPYISGHASTAVSWAQGLAEAKKLKGDNSRTVAVIGDGSLTGGMCFEALNNCGHLQSDCLVILNHNEMSISQSVGALSTYLNKIISAPVYNRFRTSLDNFLKTRVPKGKVILHLADKFEKELKGFFVPGMLFEELGFRYFGPLDGHNLDILIPTLKNVLSLKGPRILHVITKKGKGCRFSEDNPEDFHSAAPFDPAKGVLLKEPADGFGEVMAKKLSDLAQKDASIVAITAAMPKGTGLNIFADRFPARFFDVGIAEQHAVGFASGLAKKGFKPVVALYSTFLQRAFDQIIHDVALQKLNVVFVLDRAGVVGEDGPTHHGSFDIGYLRLIPEMICMAPKDKEELEDMLEFALLRDCPVSIRYPKGEAFSLGQRERIISGKSQVLVQGEDVCILGLGPMVRTALRAAELLKKDDISCGVVNARFIKPLDEAMLRSAAEKYRLLITLEDGNLDAGFGSAVLEFYEKAGLLDKVKVLRLGFPDQFIPAAKREVLFEMFGLDGQSIVSKVKTHLAIVKS